jgi:hypothetical protein
MSKAYTHSLVVRIFAELDTCTGRELILGSQTHLGYAAQHKIERQRWGRRTLNAEMMGVGQKKRHNRMPAFCAEVEG